MPHPLTSRQRAHRFSLALALVGFSLLLAIKDYWWPGVMLAIGLPLALRQYLLGRTYDMAITLLVFIGAFISAQFDLPWEIFLPVLFSLAAVYLLCREWVESREITEEEKEEDVLHELEEKNDKD